ncbi:MAG: redoxin domain-containing protein [Dehalococcoidia bacterium]|nr:redoxin domain-containing protein [Dehalococcoidia bacterium]MCB9484996.1 redoxin domain-containing protein [Thermoflexaceae bacterium]
MAAGGSTTDGKSWAGSDPAPPFPDGLTWFNVNEPLQLGALRGKVVLLDFWTLGCINCQHIIPDLKELEAQFGDAMTVVGVHSGKYATEHDDESIREAIERYGLMHPVVNDPDFVFWQRYGASAWPTLVIIDPAGNLVGYHSGEGVYPLFQPIVASLVAEFDAKGELDRTPLPLAPEATVAATVLSFPGKVLADPVGKRLFIADSGHNRILVASLDGALQAAIGDGEAGFADGAAYEARFDAPQGLGLSEDGKTLYVADTRNHAVRAVDLETNDVTTIAGTGEQLDRLPGLDAKALETALASPWDVVAAGGKLFISMAGVHQIWALNLAAGTIEPFAGTSREGINDGERRTSATLAQPSGIATDGNYLFWVDPESSSVRRTLLDGSGPVETLVGTGLFDYGDDDGVGKDAKLQHAQGLAFADGRLFVGDTYNHKVKSVTLPGLEVETLAGSDRSRADGESDEARFDEPSGLSVAGSTVYVADTNNQSIRLVDRVTGQTRTLALTNLAVAMTRLPGRLTRVELTQADVAPGVGTLQVSISTPAGYHLNSLAPGRMSLTTGDGSVVEISEASLTWQTDGSSVAFPVPVSLGPGETTVTAVVEAYYCREGEEALCFIQQAEVVVPVRVTAGASAGDVTLAYVLPADGR